MCALFEEGCIFVMRNVPASPLLTVTNRFLLLPSRIIDGVDVFHHDRPAFSVSGHLWVDAIDAHVTLLQSVKPFHLLTSSWSCSHHRHTQWASCCVGLRPSQHMTIAYHDSRFFDRTDLISVTFAFPLMVSFFILSFLVFH